MRSCRAQAAEMDSSVITNATAEARSLDFPGRRYYSAAIAVLARALAMALNSPISALARAIGFVR